MLTASKGRFEVTEKADLRRRRMPRLIMIVIAILVVAAVAGLIVYFGSSTRPMASPGGSSAPTPTTAVPTPVETSPRPTATSAPIGTESEFAPGVAVEIGELTSVDGVAVNPGEIAGPAIRVPVSFRNGTEVEISLSSLVISADYGDAHIPASELGGPGRATLPTMIPAGGSAEGVYIFAIPVDGRELVRIGVDYAVDVAPIFFEGSAPG